MSCHSRDCGDRPAAAVCVQSSRTTNAANAAGHNICRMPFEVKRPDCNLAGKPKLSFEPYFVYFTAVFQLQRHLAPPMTVAVVR